VLACASTSAFEELEQASRDLDSGGLGGTGRVIAAEGARADMSSEMCRSGNHRHGSEPFDAKILQTELSAPLLKLSVSCPAILLFGNSREGKPVREALITAVETLEASAVAQWVFARE